MTIAAIKLADDTVSLPHLQPSGRTIATKYSRTYSSQSCCSWISL